MKTLPKLLSNKQAIDDAYELLCLLCDATGIGSGLPGSNCIDSAGGIAGIVFDPNQKEKSAEQCIIQSQCEMVELYARNVPTIGGAPSKRWQYTIVEIGVCDYGHDSPPPSVDESKPMGMEQAVRAFAAATVRNRLLYTSIPDET